MSDPEAIKRAYREFLDLMPMTLAIAGLREADGSKSFTTEQMEARANVINNAFKVARQAIREAVRNG
jgi:hypothetical protein